MISWALGTFVFAVLMVTTGGAAKGQNENPDVFALRRGSINLFGDFKIDNANVSVLKPQSLQLLLYTTGGTLVSRQQITNNSRYRFLNLPFGEYNLVVELDSTEITRIYVRLTEADRGDVKRDVLMEWRDNSPANKRSKNEIISEVDRYQRSTANNALFDRAESEIGKKNYSGALSMLNQILSDDPKDFEVWNALGSVYSLQKDSGEAERAYLRALKEKPSLMIALLNLGKLRFGQKNHEGAIEVLNEAIKLRSDSSDAHFLLGEAYLQVKKGSKAANHLNEAIRLDPLGKAEAHLRLATLYNAAGMKDRAVAEYTQFLNKLPQHPEKKRIERYIEENRNQE
jgi:tetratricopeptide (TPR) repeat protein